MFLELVQPQMEELTYRTRLHARHQLEPFLPDAFPSFYHRWVKSGEERFFALAYCVHCGLFVGEGSWEAIDGVPHLQMLIDRDYRHCGFGSSLLDQLCANAKMHGYAQIQVMLSSNSIHRSFFLKRGFTPADADDLLVRKLTH